MVLNLQFIISSIMALDFLISYGMEYANFMFSTVKLLQPTLATLESLVTHMCYTIKLHFHCSITE